MIRNHVLGKAAVGLACAIALMPGTAFAATATEGNAVDKTQAVVSEMALQNAATVDLLNQANAYSEQVAAAEEAALAERQKEAEEKAKAEAANKVLEYNRALIKKIGTQESTGHTICCPSFSCAYADAVMDGTVHDHSYYTCSCCTWTDWGGGNSSFRCVGTDEELLREAYDQISAGRPTVIHVTWSGGEHWIALIGYKDATDPDHLKLSNFIALDPWDGKQINAGKKYTLYGDGCEHISDR